MRIPAERIRQARLAAGFTSQKSAAKSFGVSPRTWHSWENGDIEPGTAVLCELGNKVAKPLSWFFKTDDELAVDLESPASLHGAQQDSDQDENQMTSSMLLRQMGQLASMVERQQDMNEKVVGMLSEQQAMLKQQADRHAAREDFQMRLALQRSEKDSRHIELLERQVRALEDEVSTLKKIPRRQQQLHQSPANPGRAGER